MTSPEPAHGRLALTLTALVAVVVCLLLGGWQYGRIYRPVDGYTAEPVAAPLDRVTPAGAPVLPADVARQVTVSGTYELSEQRTEPGHLLGGQAVYWVLTPLLLADGTQVVILRGWVTQPGQSLAQPPAGAVNVTGRLEDAPSTAVRATNSRSGFLARTAQSPPDPLSLQPVPFPPPPNQAPDELHVQNALYVTQWWILAGILVVFWWRLMRAKRDQPDTEEPVALNA